MQRSPYTPGIVASWLPGRESALARIEARLEYAASAAWQPQRPVIEVAPRGFGKTSLIREAQRRAEAAGMMTAWVSAGSQQGLMADIVAEVQRAAATWPSAARRRLGQAVREVTVTIGVPGTAQVATKLGPTGGVVGAAEFGAFLRSAAQQAVKQHHRGIVLFIDEIQDADLPGLRTLALTWQHLQSEPAPKEPVAPPALVCAGLPNSSTVLTDAASYTERWEYEHLGALAPDAAEVALAGPARRLGVAWHREALDRAVRVSKGYPYLVQLLGAHTWDEAGNPDPGARIGSQEVAAAEVRAIAELTTLYRGRWERATPGEQVFLAAMATAADGPVPRAHIAATLQVDTRELSAPRASLIDKGIIIPDGYGHLSFTVPGFATFIRSMTRTPTPGPTAIDAADAPLPPGLPPAPGG